MTESGVTRGSIDLITQITSHWDDDFIRISKTALASDFHIVRNAEFPQLPCEHLGVCNLVPVTITAIF